MSNEPNTHPEKSVSIIPTIITILFILGVAGALTMWIYSSEPQAQREGATKQTAMLVEVERVKRGNYTPRITGLGMVEPAQDIMLSPRVNGRITEISDNFMPGGFVSEDEVLAKIDPADYRNTVRQRESALRQAQSDLDIEQGRRDVARQEYELLEETLGSQNKSLATREPQLDAARAAVESAKAALEQAKLDLQRTEITAPFNAQILSRNINVGSEVTPSTNLARLVGINEYWVIVTLPISKLGRIKFPSENETGSIVNIQNRASWPAGTTRTGEVLRLIGALDEQTRMARILVRVVDPLARDAAQGQPPLIIGTIVQTEIEGRPLENVIRINRDYLREGDTLWLMRDNKLKITDAEVAFKDKTHAYIKTGLEDGDQLVTSNLATVAEDVALRTETEMQTEPETSAQETETTE